MKKKQRKKVLKFTDQGNYRIEEIEVDDIGKSYSWTKDFLFLTQIGYNIATPIILGAVFGFYLDKHLATKPKITLLFIIAGVVLSFISLYKSVKKYIRNK